MKATTSSRSKSAKAKPSSANVERRRIADFLKNETFSGALILIAATAGMLLANSPLSGAYESVREHRIGPAELHLDLTVRAWIADGLLALFFFVVGLELKHEFQHGSLSKPARAIVPIAAAFGGMIAPALLYVAFNVAGDGGSLRGWGVPMATDIAFALAVLSLFGRKLPLTLRAFLLTLAIVDDLGAIAIIAIFYSGGVELPALLLKFHACYLQLLEDFSEVSFWSFADEKFRKAREGIEQELNPTKKFLYNADMLDRDNEDQRTHEQFSYYIPYARFMELCTDWCKKQNITIRMSSSNREQHNKKIFDDSKYAMLTMNLPFGMGLPPRQAVFVLGVTDLSCPLQLPPDWRSLVVHIK